MNSLQIHDRPMPNSSEIITFGRFQDDKDSCKLQTSGKKRNTQENINELPVVKRNKIPWNYCVIPSLFPMSKESSPV